MIKRTGVSKIDVTDPSLGFILIVLVLLTCAVVDFTLYRGSWEFFSITSIIAINLGIVGFVLGSYLGTKSIEHILRLQQRLNVPVLTLFVLTAFMFALFFFTASPFPWHLTMLLFLSLATLSLTLVRTDPHRLGRTMSLLGIVLIIFSFILWRSIPALLYFPAGELSVVTRTTPSLIIGYLSLLFGSILLMSDGKAWARTWGLIVVISSTMLLYWVSLWFLVAIAWLAVLTALRHFDAVTQRELLIIVLVPLALLLVTSIVLPIFGIANPAFPIIHFISHTFICLGYAIGVSNFWTGTTWGGVSFGIPEGRALLLDLYYASIGLPTGQGGMDATLFGHLLVDFGLIGMAIILFLLGFILIIAYEATRLSSGETRRIMISTYAIAYAFFLLSIIRGSDFIFFTIIATLLSVSFYTLSQLAPAASAPSLTPAMLNFLQTLNESGSLFYYLLTDEGRKIADDLYRLGMAKIDVGIVRITDAGKSIIEGKLGHRQGISLVK